MAQSRPRRNIVESNAASEKVNVVNEVKFLKFRTNVLVKEGLYDTAAILNAIVSESHGYGVLC
jgi:predicted NAD-dependent protein-ADP-ribosyltransferase YbiA (DUF1768 family)